MKHFFRVLIAVAALTSTLEFAQASGESFNLMWGQNYLHEDMESGKAVFQIGDRLLLVGTHQYGRGGSWFGAQLLWLDLDGEVLDSALVPFPVPGAFLLHAILTPTGNVVVCGAITNHDGDDIWRSGFAAEISLSAKELTWWTIMEAPYALDVEWYQGCRTSNGDYFFVGRLVTLSRYHNLQCWARSDAVGNLLALDTLGLQGGFGYALAVAPTEDGGVVISGTFPGLRAQVVKLDQNNEIVWESAVGPYSSGACIRKIIELPNGHLIYGGDCNSGDLLIARTNRLGEEIWFRRMPMDGNQTGFDLLYLIRQQRFLLVGENQDMRQMQNVILATLEPDGDVHTLEVIRNGNYLVDPRCALQLADCTVVVAGSAIWFEGTGLYVNAFYASRYSPDRRTYGPPQPFSLISPENDDTVSSASVAFRWMTAIEEDPYDTVYYAFRCWSSEGEYAADSLLDTCLTVPREQLLNLGGSVFQWEIAAHSSRPDATVLSSEVFSFLLESPSGASDLATLSYDFRFSAHPNPFNPSTVLSFTLPRPSPVTLSVFNTLGQTVYRVNLGVLDAGEHRRAFNAIGLPTGMYLARIETADFSRTLKLMVVK